MANLISPEGKPYQTDDPREINDLVLGRGYRRAEQDRNEHQQQLPQPETPGRQPAPPAPPGTE